MISALSLTSNPIHLYSLHASLTAGRGQQRTLRQKLGMATTYDEWKATALELDGYLVSNICVMVVACYVLIGR